MIKFFSLVGFIFLLLIFLDYSGIVLIENNLANPHITDIASAIKIEAMQEELHRRYLVLPYFYVIVPIIVFINFLLVMDSVIEETEYTPGESL